MNAHHATASPRVTALLGVVKRFTPAERLALAKLLLDSLLISEGEDNADWQDLGLTAFEKEWDNPDDAVYDNWRELYGVAAR